MNGRPKEEGQKTLAARVDLARRRYFGGGPGSLSSKETFFKHNADLGRDAIDRLFETQLSTRFPRTKTNDRVYEKRLQPRYYLHQLHMDLAAFHGPQDKDKYFLVIVDCYSGACKI